MTDTPPPTRLDLAGIRKRAEAVSNNYPSFIMGGRGEYDFTAAEASAINTAGHIVDTDIPALLAALEGAYAVVDRLPRTRDGAVLIFGRNYWLNVPVDEGAQWETRGCGVVVIDDRETEDSPFFLRVRDTQGEEHYVKDSSLHSTEQTARAAASEPQQGEKA